MNAPLLGARELLSEVEGAAGASSWVHDGARVYYRTSDLPGGPEFAGVCDGEPFLVGRPGESTLCIRLREMESAYRAGKRSDVAAAVVARLRVRSTLTGGEAVRAMTAPTPDKRHEVAQPTPKPTRRDAAAVAPPIVTLCGSTRFRRAFESAVYRLTLEGWAVLSVACFSRAHDTDEARDALSVEQKVELDRLHLRKIAMSQRVHVLNPGGYIGESTRNEIAFAFSLGIQITFLDEARGNAWLEDHSHELGRMVAQHVGGAR